MNPRSSHLDVAKGIAIVAVVYGHAAVLMMAYPFYKDVVGIQGEVIFTFAMPLFFLISGSFQRVRLSSPKFNHRTYLSKIATSLLLPFYALGLLFLLGNVLLGEWVNAPSVPAMLTALLVQQSNGSTLPSVVLWFLFVLFLFHVITYLYAKIFKFRVVYLLPLAVLLRLKLDLFDDWTFFGFDKICDYFLFYLLGYVFFKRVIEKPISSPLALIGLAACYALGFGIQHADPEGPFSFLMNPFGIHELALTLLVIGVSYQLAQRFQERKVMMSLAYFGAYSILVYVFHMPIMTVFRVVAVRLGIPGNYYMLFFLFIPGAVLPLLAGKILAIHKPTYKTLLGRNP
jgi:fucose 4-O-acetylase-like acetyltransferase